jgi:hypothetical protein
MPVFIDATRTTIPLLANLVPPILERPAGPMLNLGNNAPRAPRTEPQATTAVKYNQLIAPQQDNQYRGANGPRHRQRQLHFGELEAHCCNRGNCNGRRNRDYNGEGQNPMIRHFAKGPKMEFPEFMGDQVEGWIKKANKYFKLAQTPDEWRVEIATLYFTGRADTWLDGSGIGTDEISWLSFCRKLKKRFAEQSEYDVIALFHKIQQVTIVDAYINEFEETMREVRKDNPDLPENYFVRSFVAGLKDYVQNLTQVQRPDSLHEAYWLARRFEQSYPFKKNTQRYSSIPAKNNSGYK